MSSRPLWATQFDNWATQFDKRSVAKECRIGRFFFYGKCFRADTALLQISEVASCPFKANVGNRHPLFQRRKQRSIFRISLALGIES
jgi:hypothetical protein